MTAIRTVTCRSCGALFGEDARLGVSEVVGCHKCPEKPDTRTLPTQEKNHSNDCVDSKQSQRQALDVDKTIRSKSHV